MSHVRKGDWKWGKSLRLCPYGHRIFHDNVSKRWAIADNSGNLPEHTEDGVLWLDLEAGVTISMVDSESPMKPRVVDVVRGSIAVYRHKPGEHSFVSLQPAAIVRLARETGCAVKLGGDSELLKTISQLVCLAPLPWRPVEQPTTVADYVSRGDFENITDDDRRHLHALCDGEVRRPGKFEGERPWVPFFYELIMLGVSDFDRGAHAFSISDVDRKLFPELHKAHRVMLSIDDQGFVRGEVVL